MSEACVILNDIHIDIMDYIKPAYCNKAHQSFSIYKMLDFFSSSKVCGQNLSGRTGLTSITQCYKAFPLMIQYMTTHHACLPQGLKST
jgi:hypothetical protein